MNKSPNSCCECPFLGVRVSDDPPSMMAVCNAVEGRPRAGYGEFKNMNMRAMFCPLDKGSITIAAGLDDKRDEYAGRRRNFEGARR